MTPDHANLDNERGNHEHVADWDAAYVLGALSPIERKDFETHLESCERCRSAVAELSGLPGLLGRLDAPRAFALLESPDSESDSDIPTPPADLVARIERRETRRRSRRTRLVVGISAAAVVAAAIAIPLSISVAPHPTVSTALSQVVAGPLSADVTLTGAGWGTKVDMSCRYGDAANGASDDARWDYALWVVDRNGDASELSSWSATSGSTVNLSAGTSLPVDQIASVEVRSIPDDAVLLRSALH